MCCHELIEWFALRRLRAHLLDVDETCERKDSSAPPDSLYAGARQDSIDSSGTWKISPTAWTLVRLTGWSALARRTERVNDNGEPPSLAKA
jgi:hypothetical protein